MEFVENHNQAQLFLNVMVFFAFFGGCWAWESGGRGVHHHFDDAGNVSTKLGCIQIC